MVLPKAARIGARIFNYRLSRLGIARPANPINFTFSVTNKCQSRCLSCNIWALYRKEPGKSREELTLEEIEKMFASLGPVYFFNLSGGCPFLRRDLPEIVELACKYLKPSVVHIPTNALAVEKTALDAEKILNIMAVRAPAAILQIKPSLDGVGERHDAARGVPGNFDKLSRLVARLKTLQQRYPALHVGLGTVISKNNIRDLPEIIACADSFGVDSYISEPAENRDEMFNLADAIAPAPEDFRDAMRQFKAFVRSKLNSKRGLTRVTEAFRLVYYDLSAEIVERKKQVIPCYGGISNVHVDPYGNVWPCCILGNTRSMGNLRDHDFRFGDIWHSQRAAEVRAFIRRKKCHCPLANQAYANILCHFGKLARVLGYLLGFTANGVRDTRRSSA
jgi:MoaA/NifB/PqqE/SkfB family radical SAM enzyme